MLLCGFFLAGERLNRLNEAVNSNSSVTVLGEKSHLAVKDLGRN
jgi:hypothetical protein